MKSRHPTRDPRATHGPLHVYFFFHRNDDFFHGSRWRVDMCFEISFSIGVLQHTATHCNTLLHTATHCNTLQHTATHYNTPHHIATHGNTLQYTATHCNTLQHTATHFNAMQHTATHSHSPNISTKTGIFHKQAQQHRETTKDCRPIRDPQVTHYIKLHQTATNCNTL